MQNPFTFDTELGLFEQPEAPRLDRLTEWQDKILRIWSKNNDHVADDTEVLSFCGILSVSMECLRNRLNQLHEFNQKTNEALGNASFPGLFAKTDSELTQDSAIFMESNLGSLGLDRLDDLNTQPNQAPGCMSNHNEYCQNYGHNNADSLQLSHLGFCLAPTSNVGTHTLSDVLTAVPTSATESFGSGVFDIESFDKPLLSTSGNFYLKQQTLPSFDSTGDGSLITTATDGIPGTSSELLRLISSFCQHRRRRGCGSIRDHETQTGKYRCSLGCGRRFRSSCDLFRHEEIVYPQQFWFCFTCGDMDQPSERHLFTREDKIRQHIRTYHPGGLTARDYKVTDARTLYPERCEMCLHYKFRNWKDRSKHIIQHVKRGKSLSKSGSYDEKQRKPTDSVNHPDGDEDDDDDDDDNNDHDYDRRIDSDDEENNNDGDEDEPSDGKEDNQFGPSEHMGEDGSGHAASNGDQDNEDSDSGTSYPEFWLFHHAAIPQSLPKEHHRSVSNALEFPHMIAFSQFREPIKQLPEMLPILWCGNVSHKGISSVHKVLLPTFRPLNHEHEIGCQNTTYAVKRYASRYQPLFEREKKVFETMYSTGTWHLHIIRCYGTFVDTDDRGEQSYNIVLEYGESDLNEYWKNQKKPSSNRSKSDYWANFAGIVDALACIHRGGHSRWGCHNDIKPDNILIVGGVFKLIDFGFADFGDSHLDPHIEGCGRTAAYEAPERYKARPITTEFSSISSSDIWSMGCVLLEGLAWYNNDSHGLQRHRVHRRAYRSGTKPMRLLAHACFHDGEKVKRGIESWCRNLRARYQHSDMQSIAISELIMNSMLCENPSSRLGADRVAQILRSIVRAHSSNQDKQIELPRTALLAPEKPLPAPEEPLLTLEATSLIPESISQSLIVPTIRERRSLLSTLSQETDVVPSQDGDLTSTCEARLSRKQWMWREELRKAVETGEEIMIEPWESVLLEFMTESWGSLDEAMASWTRSEYPSSLPLVYCRDHDTEAAISLEDGDNLQWSTSNYGQDSCDSEWDWEWDWECFTKTFTPRSDLIRHKHSDHRKLAHLWCPIDGCHRSASFIKERPFQRRDEVNFHMRKVHSKKTCDIPRELKILDRYSAKSDASETWPCGPHLRATFSRPWVDHRDESDNSSEPRSPTFASRGLTRHNTGDPFGSDQYFALPPGNWLHDLHGNCPTCYHDDRLLTKKPDCRYQGQHPDSTRCIYISKKYTQMERSMRSQRWGPTQTHRISNQITGTSATSEPGIYQLELPESIMLRPRESGSDLFLYAFDFDLFDNPLLCSETFVNNDRAERQTRERWLRPSHPLWYYTSCLLLVAGQRREMSLGLLGTKSPRTALQYRDLKDLLVHRSSRPHAARHRQATDAHTNSFAALLNQSRFHSCGYSVKVWKRYRPNLRRKSQKNGRWYHDQDILSRLRSADQHRGSSIDRKFRELAKQMSVRDQGNDEYCDGGNVRFPTNY